MTVVLGNIGRDCVIWTNLHVYIADPIDILMTSHGNAFHITGPLCGESTIHRHIPLQRTRGAEHWYIFLLLPWISCWADCRIVGDLRRYDIITSLYFAVLLPSGEDASDWPRRRPGPDQQESFTNRPWGGWRDWHPDGGKPLQYEHL